MKKRVWVSAWLICLVADDDGREKVEGGELICGHDGVFDSTSSSQSRLNRPGAPLRPSIGWFLAVNLPEALGKFQGQNVSK